MLLSWAPSHIPDTNGSSPFPLPLYVQYWYGVSRDTFEWNLCHTDHNYMSSLHYGFWICMNLWRGNTYPSTIRTCMLLSVQFSLKNCQFILQWEPCITILNKAVKWVDFGMASKMSQQLALGIKCHKKDDWSVGQNQELWHSVNTAVLIIFGL